MGKLVNISKYLNIFFLPRSLNILTFIFVIYFSSSSFADEKFIVKHYQTQVRYKFGASLLKLALSKVNGYEVKGVNYKHMNENRGEFEVLAGRLDIQWLTATEHRSKNMIPINIPIYRGILGLRLLLVTRNNFEAISRVRTIFDLQKFTAGHGKNWKDVNIYKANNLGVEVQFEYELLFKMLIAGRFDYFHRGVNEIWDELKRYSNDLHIADNIMLYYNQPVFFYVNKNQKKLAQDLEKGLLLIIEDGSYKKLFLETFGTYLNDAKLNQRTLINLNNPEPISNKIKIDKTWWLK